MFRRRRSCIRRNALLPHIPQSHRSTLERFSQEVPSKRITWWCSGAKPLISRCGRLLGGWETTGPGQVWSLLIVRIAEPVEQVRQGVDDAAGVDDHTAAGCDGGDKTQEAAGVWTCSQIVRRRTV
jgi:hypothetical protein